MKKKPTKEEWVDYGMEQDLEPLLEAVRNLDPQKLESYLSKDKIDNPYIFDPKRTT